MVIPMHVIARNVFLYSIYAPTGATDEQQQIIGRSLKVRVRENPIRAGPSSFI